MEIENFLKELSELTQKYNIGVGGCGCCGSPFLFNIETEEILDNKEKHPIDSKLEWDNLGKIYVY